MFQQETNITYGRLPSKLFLLKMWCKCSGFTNFHIYWWVWQIFTPLAIYWWSLCVPFPAMSVWNILNFLSKYCFDLLLQ
jgi:hypothetical protein